MGQINKRRTFTRQYKQDAVNLVLNGDKTAREIAESLGINPAVLYRWIREQNRESAKGGEAFPGKGRLSPQEEEMRKLRRELERAREDTEILKKALEYFSKNGK